MSVPIPLQSYSIYGFTPYYDLPTLYKSTDGGVTFGRAQNGIYSDTYIRPLVMDPSDPIRLWFGDYGEALSRTSNGATNWERVSRGNYGGNYGSLTAIGIQGKRIIK